MADLSFETVIQRPMAAVFDLIADLPGYGAWLSPSNLYGSTVLHSRAPVERGSQYVDQGKMSRMTGRVIEFAPPERITFRQETNSLLGALTVEIRYTLAAAGDGTRVRRDIRVQSSGGYRLAQGVLLGSIRQESERILEAMKAWLEKED